MTKKMKTRLLGIVALFFGGAILTGCTKSFCTVNDKANQMYVYEQKNLSDINKQATAKGILLPSADYLAFIDAKVTKYITDTPNFPVLSNGNFQVGIAKFGGYTAKEIGNKGDDISLFANYNRWYLEAQTTLGLAKCPSRDYIKLYEKSLESGVSTNTACLTPVSGEFGHTGTYLEGKTWGQAFTEFGVIEGLLVYPVGWLLHQITSGIGTTGWGQVLAIIIVTFIVRGFLILCTFKSTLGTQKMQTIQPEVAKLQNKYPHAQTNQYEKQKFAQEQMALYKKEGIHPFSQILVMLLQMPVFIAVWGAMQGSAILTQGSVFGLNLNTVTMNAIMAFDSSTPFAIILFLLMSLAQFASTKAPTWLVAKKVAASKVKLTATNDADKQQHTMKMVSYVMLAFIIIMGLTLPAAMGIYWYMSAIIGILQTIVTQMIMSKVGKKKKKEKIKNATVRR